MKSKTEKSEATWDADLKQSRATQERPDVSSQYPTSEPPKFGGILFFDEADALYDDPIEAKDDGHSNKALNRP